MSHIHKILTTIIILFAIPNGIHAFSSYSVDSQGFDKSLSEGGALVYSTPTNIKISQVTTTSDSLSRNPSEWVQTLFYYTITRLSLSDIPYTYLLDENGTIYDGKIGGIGANPELREPDGTVLIGYLSNNPVLTNRASESLQTMIEEISYKWGIAQLSTVKMSIYQEEGKLSSIVLEEIDNEFTKSITDSLVDWQGHDSEHLEYKAKIEEAIYEEEVEIGERLSVKVKIKNLNDFIWLTDKDPVYISTLSGEESDFAVNTEWASFSKPASISEQNVLPGESVELEFDLEAKFSLGDTQESFILLKSEENPFEGSQFDIKFKIVKGDKQLVEISSPRYSFANLRECRWYSCEVLDSVDNGTILIYVSEEADWSKVQFGVDLYGWINSAYLKRL